MRTLLGICLSVALLVTGCIGRREPPAPAPFDEQQAPLDELQREEAIDAPEVGLPGEVNYHGTRQLGTAEHLDLTADDNYFEPTFVRAIPGTTLTVEVSNEGRFVHTFTVAELDLDLTITSGAITEVEVTVPDDGALRFYCGFHEQSGMQGAFVADGAG